MAVYATRADLLAALSQDSQAKLTTDTTRRFVVGTGPHLHSQVHERTRLRKEAA